MTLKSRNYFRNRAYEELGLKPIQSKTAASRAREYGKWCESNGFIKGLIRTSDQFEARKHTWSKTIRMRLKRFRIDLTESSSLGRSEVLNEYIPRVRSRDRMQACREATRLKLGSGKQTRRLEFNSLCPSDDLYHLTRLRTGTYQFTNKLVFGISISPRYLNKCAFCGRNTTENAEYLMIQCTPWNEERLNFF